MPPRRGDQIEHVLLDLVVDVHAAERFARLEHVRATRARLELRQLGEAGAPQDLLFLGALGVADPDLEHEAVALRLGQRIGALLLDRILGREDQERLLELQALVAERDLLLLHRLEQRGLHLRGGAVDLVREHEVREQRAALRREGSIARVVDHRPGQVRREQVRGELDAAELEREGVREAPHRERLREPGDALEQDVPAGQEPDQQAVHHLPLPHQGAGHLLPHPGEDLAGPFDPARGFLRVDCHRSLSPKAGRPDLERRIGPRAEARAQYSDAARAVQPDAMRMREGGRACRRAYE